MRPSSSLQARLCALAGTAALVAALAVCSDAPLSPTAPRPTLATAQAVNLLLDPGFEAKGQGWLNVAKGGRGIDSATVHAGRYSERIVASNLYGRFVYQDLAVTAGASYDAAAWISTTGLGGQGSALVVHWLSAAGQPEALPPASVIRTDTVGTLAGTQGWTRRAASYVAPAGAVAARVQLSMGLEPDNAGRAWFDDVELAAAIPDAGPPTVTLTVPTDGAMLTGTVTLTADASDDVVVAGVRFQVDGADVGAEDASAPYAATLNTTALANGSHTIRAVARDAAGNVGASAAVTVTVANQQTVNLVADPGFEAGGQGWQNATKGGRSIDATVAHTGTRSLRIVASNLYGRYVYQDVAVAAGGSYAVAGWLTTNGLGGQGGALAVLWLNAAGLGELPPPASVLRVDTVGTLAGTQGWTRRGGSLAAPAGAAVARVQLSTGLEPDNAGRAWFDDIELTASTPDAHPPTVAVTAPAAGATLSGTVTLAADASDDVGVAGVRFRVDGADATPEDATAPYTATLGTGTLANGSHAITAVARDLSGNVTVSAPVSVTVSNRARPNIVLILTDDQRHDLMPYLPLTTALLSGEAVQFRHGFAPTPNCCPARATILTGQYSHNTGVLQSYGTFGGATRFDPSSTIATWLHAAGYRTGIYGKYLNDYARLAPAVPPGWSEFHGFVRDDDDFYYNWVLNDNGVLTTFGSTAADYSTTVMAQKAAAFIASTPASQPLFLYYTPFGPHQPATPHPSDVGSFSSQPPYRPPSYDEADVSDKPAWVRALPRIDAATQAASDAFHQKQLETLQSVDRAVVTIVDALKASGRWSNTMLIFASDNGLMWGEHRVVDTKFCAYDECVRVPVWVRVPGQAPRVDDHLVSQIDFAPTIAEWAGAAPATMVNGRSLVPLLADPGTMWRTELLLENRQTGSLRTSFSAVRTARWLYAEYDNGDRELYDLQADPFQLVNVVNDPANAAIVTDLQGRLNVLRSS